MNRREMIHSLAMAAGCGLAAELAWPAEPGVHVHHVSVAAADSHQQPRKSLLTRVQRENLETLAEMIIPKTDTGGAAEAGVGTFIDHVFSEWYQPAERAVFLSGLASLDAHCVDKFGHSFHDSTAGQQIMALSDSEQRSLAYRPAGSAAANAAPDEHAPFFYRLRALVVLGYYTSELGATTELTYNPVPASYEGDYDFDKVGHQWSS